MGFTPCGWQIQRVIASVISYVVNEEPGARRSKIFNLQLLQTGGNNQTTSFIQSWVNVLLLKLLILMGSRNSIALPL